MTLVYTGQDPARHHALSMQREPPNDGSSRGDNLRRPETYDRIQRFLTRTP